MDLPSTEIAASELESGINILDLLLRTGLIPSKGEGRRLVQQGGIYIDEAPVPTIDFIVGKELFKDGELIIKKGKKTYHKIIAVG